MFSERRFIRPDIEMLGRLIQERHTLLLENVAAVLDKYYTSVRPLSNINLIHMFILSFANCVVLHNNVSRFMLLLEINYYYYYYYYLQGDL